MSENEKDLKAELMELINGEHKQTEDNILVAIFQNGHLKELISCLAFVFDCLDSSDDTTSLFCCDDFNLGVIKNDIDYHVMKFLDKRRNSSGD